MQKAEWFVDWFDSPYYHLLYNNRSHEEARLFIDNLCAKLNLQAGSHLWDLACGKGRHSLALNQKGYDVTGTDLSANSIAEASRNASDTLHFFQHDMREPFKQAYFEAVFNLFTSIGYFTDSRDNSRVFKHVADALTPGGFFVVDFFNARKVACSIKDFYREERGEIIFDISKKIEHKAIHKRISFADGGKNYYFNETVSLLTRQDFDGYAAETGLTHHAAFGNYFLEEYNEELSDRLILIYKKPIA